MEVLSSGDVAPLRVAGVSSAPTIQIERVSDGYFLDFDDDTFKASGWVQKSDSMIADGEVYEYDWDSTGIISAKTAVIVHYFESGVLLGTETIFFDYVSAGGGGGLTAQETRDAMKLAPTGGNPASGSIDYHLDIHDNTSSRAQFMFWGLGVTSVEFIYGSTSDLPVGGIDFHSSSDPRSWNEDLTDFGTLEQNGSWTDGGGNTGFPSWSGSPTGDIVLKINFTGYPASSHCYVFIPSGGQSALILQDGGGGAVDETNDISGVIRYYPGVLDFLINSGKGGLTAQETRDAMKLAPTGGNPASGSIDYYLDIHDNAASRAQFIFWDSKVSSVEFIYGSVSDLPVGGIDFRSSSDPVGWSEDLTNFGTLEQNGSWTDGGGNTGFPSWNGTPTGDIVLKINFTGFPTISYCYVFIPSGCQSALILKDGGGGYIDETNDISGVIKYYPGVLEFFIQKLPDTASIASLDSMLQVLAKNYWEINGDNIEVYTDSGKGTQIGTFVRNAAKTTREWVPI